MEIKLIISDKEVRSLVSTGKTGHEYIPLKKEYVIRNFRKKAGNLDKNDIARLIAELIYELDEGKKSKRR